MNKITTADRESLVDLLEITEARGEEDSDVLRGFTELRRRLENGETPLRSEAVTLRDIVREFAEAYEGDPSAMADEERVIYDGLIGRLTAISGE